MLKFLIPQCFLPRPTDGLVASLRGIQARYIAAAGRSGDVAWAIRACIEDVCELHGVGTHMRAWVIGYMRSASRRVAMANADVSCEINRAVNAANHEALRLAHGVNLQVRWIGGKFDGQVRGITDTWEGRRHPPLSADDADCFLIPANQSGHPGR